MKNFISSKNSLTITILWFLVLFLSVMMFISYQEKKVSIVPIIIISLVTALIIWVLLDTRYVIKNGNLLYRSGPFRGRIDINKIKSIYVIILKINSLQYYFAKKMPTENIFCWHFTLLKI